jgi:hypothetical protein
MGFFRCYSCDNLEGPVKCTLKEDGKLVGRYVMSVDDAQYWQGTGRLPNAMQALLK